MIPYPRLYFLISQHENFSLLFFIGSSLIVYGQPVIRIPEIAVPKLKTVDTRLKAETTIFKAQNSNPFALVAGGSKGIGFAIAEALALRRYNLILIAGTSPFDGSKTNP